MGCGNSLPADASAASAKTDTGRHKAHDGDAWKPTTKGGRYLLGDGVGEDGAYCADFTHETVSEAAKGVAQAEVESVASAAKEPSEASLDWRIKKIVVKARFMHGINDELDQFEPGDGMPTGKSWEKLASRVNGWLRSVARATAPTTWAPTPGGDVSELSCPDTLPGMVLTESHDRDAAVSCVTPSCLDADTPKATCLNASLSLPMHASSTAATPKSPAKAHNHHSTTVIALRSSIRSASTASKS